MTMSDPETPDRWRRPVLRGGLGFLALAQGVIGTWALLGPEAFYRHFPGTAVGWVSLLPPYNEHLVRDVGALSLALTVLLGYAAVRPEPRTVRLALAAFAVYAVPHTIFHALHLEGFAPADALAQMVGFAVQLALLVVLFLATIRRRERG
jgi:hypothetical protein